MRYYEPIDIVCNGCKCKQECDAWDIIKKIRELDDSILPEEVCDNITKGLETFNYCEYKEI